jgi:hypothetical protein
MSIKTIYVCDNCGAEQHTPDQFWNVGVNAELVNYPFKNDKFVQSKMLQVCRPCLESFGIYVQNKPNEPEKPIPTTAELLVKLISQISVEAINE